MALFCCFFGMNYVYENVTCGPSQRSICLLTPKHLGQTRTVHELTAQVPPLVFLSQNVVFIGEDIKNVTLDDPGSRLCT